MTAAATTVGVGLRTVYDWLARGRTQPYGQLLARVDAVLDERKQPTWQETLARLDAEYEHWQPPPLREVLREVDEFDLLLDAGEARVSERDDADGHGDPTHSDPRSGHAARR